MSNGTKDRALLYWTGLVRELIGYTDADWAGEMLVITCVHLDMHFHLEVS